MIAVKVTFPLSRLSAIITLVVAGDRLRRRTLPPAICSPILESAAAEGLPAARRWL
jgi:hypothetical protein